MSIPLRGAILGLTSALLLLTPMRALATEGHLPSRSFELTYRATVRGIPAGVKVVDRRLTFTDRERPSPEQGGRR